MERWWWITVPYGLVFPAYGLLTPNANAHALMPLIVLSWITALSAGVWTLATVTRVVILRKAQWTKKTTIMLY